jgi:hypothetical protein
MMNHVARFSRWCGITRSVATAASASAIILLLSGCGSSPTTPSPIPPPSLSGQWAGTYQVTTCVESVPLGFCGAVGGGGQHVLTPAQSGSNFTGQLAIGGFSIPISGSVDPAGVVTLAGTGPVSFATLTVTTWRAVMNGSSMAGTMSYSVFADGAAATVNATLTLTR